MLAADTQAGELRPGGCWDTRLTQDKARPRWGDWGPKGPWFKPQALSGCVKRAGEWSTAARSQSAGLGVLRAGGGDSLLCALCDLEQGSHQRRGGWNNRVWSWEAWGLDKAHRQGESLLELAGGWQGISNVCQKLSRLAWCSLPDRAHWRAPGLGRGSRGLSLQSLGTAALTRLSSLAGPGRAFSYLGSVQLIQHHHRGAVIVEHQPPEVCHGVGERVLRDHEGCRLLVALKRMTQAS